MSSTTPTTRARELATRSQGTVWEALLDAVRNDAAGGGNGSDCEDDPTRPPNDAADEKEKSALLDPAPSLYAAALLLGRTLEADRAALAKLQDADTVALVEVSSPHLVGPVSALLRKHVFGSENVISPVTLRTGGNRVADYGAVAIFADRDDGRPPKPEAKDELVSAVRARCAIVGVSADPESLLPPSLVRIASARLVLPPLDGDGIRAVIREVTGIDPGPVEADIAAAADEFSLDLAVRADLGARASLDRLRLLVAGPTAKRDASVLPLSQMHGLGEAGEWALNLVADVKAYARGDLSTLQGGAVLWSRPGCGKTAVARALAAEAGCTFIATSYAQWQARREGHLGHVTQAIRETFAEARRKAPSIVFIDEIDTLGSRGTSKRDEDWWRAIVNCLLEELDGFARREGVVVIGACNNPERLDPALVRSGRLDRLIEIPLPDVPALAAIFRTHLGEELPGDDLLDVALIAHGGTGADVMRWVRDARAAARRAARPLTKADVVKIVRGYRQALPEHVRRRIAHHEAGHAIAIVATGIGVPVSLSIGDKGGLSHNELGERRSLTRAHLENHLMILLAGRAAEVLVYGEGTAGAGGGEDSDLAGATSIAAKI